MKRILPLLLAFVLTACAATPVPPLETTATIAPVTEPATESATTPTEPAAETTTPTVQQETTAATRGPDEIYTVRICRADFPIYDGPGYDHFPVGTVQVATLYTIMDEFSDGEGNIWGRLKSGAGWVDLTRNEKETKNMPAVTVSRAGETLPEDAYYCEADSSQFAYFILLLAHEPLTEVSLFSLNTAENYEKGPELFHICDWDPERPFAVSISFPGSTSLYGLEFTDSRGVTQLYTIWESGRNGAVEISPFQP